MAVVSPQDMAPEQRLIVYCSAVDLSDEGGTELRRALGEGPDWSRVTELAEWHRLSPLLFVHLGREDLRDMVPIEVIVRLEAAFYTTAARAALYRQELASVLSILSRTEIPVMLLKGSALVGTVYPHPGLRSMNDLDFLVPSNLLQEAERALGEQGWTPVGDERRNARMRESFRHFPGLTNPAGTVSVELHRELVSPPVQWDVARVWERAAASESHSPALLPSPEDLLAHVALHFFMDRHEPRPGALRQVMDISEIIRFHQALDWDYLLIEAKRSGSLGALACGLWTAHRLLAVPVPDWVLHAAATDGEGPQAFIEQRVLGKAPWPLRGLVEPRQEYSIVRVMRNLFRRFFPSRRYLEARYSGVSRIPLVWLAHHLRDVAIRWRKSISRPVTIRQGLLADRWLHSLLNRASDLPDH